MSDKLHDTCYMWFPRKCGTVRRRMATTRCVDDHLRWSAEGAWAQRLELSRETNNPRPDPADYIIVAGFVTDEMDKNGARLIRADWSHTYDPQGFYEEVERERRLAEEVG